MKIATSLLILVLLLLLGCDPNDACIKSAGRKNTIALIRLPDGSTKQLAVKRWIRDVGEMVEVETENEVYWTHSVNLVLIKDK